MRRRFAQRRPFVRAVGKSNVQWSPVPINIGPSAVTLATVLISLESPANLTAVTSDPPEDMTLLRIRGSFRFALAGADAAIWTAALLVQDATWTPSTFAGDSDKRMLWYRTYRSTNSTSDVWSEPNLYNAAGAGSQVGDMRVNELDIAPKVRIEPGQSLYLVLYETAGAATAAISSFDMRVLYKRSGRRSR